MGVKLCVTFREENKLRVNKDKALREKLGLREMEVTGVWRKMHN